MNHIDERSPEQIQADIQRTRSDLDRTLTRLERRLEPRRLMDQGVDYLRDNGAREYLSNLGRAAKEQPLPLALVGVGLAWMMMTNGRPRSSDFDGRRLGADLREPVSGASWDADEGPNALKARASELGSKVSGAASDLASQTRDAAHRASQGLSDAADVARARATQVSEAARRSAEKVRTGYDQIVNEQPLALGAIGLAIGAVLAAAAPRTRQEDELMGASSDRLLDDAKRAGSEKLEQVQGVLAGAPEPEPEPELEPNATQATRASERDEWGGGESAPPLQDSRAPEEYGATGARDGAPVVGYGQDDDVRGLRHHTIDGADNQTR